MQRRGIADIPAGDHYPRKAQDILPAVPAVKAQQHIAANGKVQLCPGIFPSQFFHREHRIVAVSGSGLLDHRKAQKLVADLIRELNIKVSDPHLPVKTLSGGNAQRIAIAKWVATNPRILILDSPTVGVDIANKEGIYQIARDLAEQGMAVLMICDEIPEAYYNSHRVLVMRRGRLVAEFNPHHCREEEIAEVVEVINE